MAMQYQGSVTVAGVKIFVTGASANLARRPIAPDLVWGGGWKVNYATGQFDPTFSINFPWFQSYGTSLLSKCIEENVGATGARNTFFSANLFNGGVNMSFSNCKCASISFSADAMGNSPLTCSATFAAKDCAISGTDPGANLPPANVDGQTPVPSYLMNASALIGADAVSSGIITSFDLQVDNNIFKLYTLNGSEVPSDIQLGLLKVTGSYSFYSAGHSSSAGKTGSFTATGGGLNFAVPSVLYDGDGNDITGPNGKPMRVMRFEGFGTSSSPPITV